MAKEEKHSIELTPTVYFKLKAIADAADLSVADAMTLLLDETFSQLIQEMRKAGKK